MKKRFTAGIMILALISICLCGYTAKDDLDCYCPPKYVFLFIGDGMSYPQIALTNYYLNDMRNLKHRKNGLASTNQLTFLDFAVKGTAQTYNRDSFIPDSSSAGTAIASGKKTSTGFLNVSPDQKKTYKTIAERLKQKKKYKVGIISSVNLNHATPAAFYAHQVSRTNYYDIGLELIESKFDYFAGGEFLAPDGMDGAQKNLYELAKESGYQVVQTQAEAEELSEDSGKCIVIGEHLADSGSLSYEIDRKEGEWALSDYVENGIEVLDNEKGFFLMVESGKIDWACHANDAATVLHEVDALNAAVDVAMEFYLEHPTETLILVTGDHETGGLALGSAGTGYDTFFRNLDHQQISFTQFQQTRIPVYRKNQTPFQQVMDEVEGLFGLKVPEYVKERTMVRDALDSHGNGRYLDSLEVTAYEYELLEEAYKKTMESLGKEIQFSQQEYLLYGGYDPLTVTITHILAQKCGVEFSTYAHTALPVPVMAKGIGAGRFSGYYDNTEVYQRLCAVLELK